MYDHPWVAIRNPGVAPYHGFTVLGISTSSGEESLIGQFGSGAKHAANLLLRHGIPPVICCGNLKLEFGSREQVVDGRSFRRAVVKFSGKDQTGRSRSGTEDLGFTLEHGDHDWNSVAMAMREYIANAIDRAVKEKGTHEAVVIEMVDSPRARRGWTSVFVPATDEVRTYLRKRDEMFLHFSERGMAAILEKCDQTPAKIYKKGVFVRESTKHSVYDYNLGEDFILDECRNSDENDARWAVCRAVLGYKSPQFTTEILRRVREEPELFEADFPSEVLNSFKTRLAESFTLAFGEQAVICTDLDTVREHVQRKGFEPITLPANFDKALRRSGVKRDTEVLDGAQVRGHESFEPPPEMVEVVDSVWRTLESFHMTNGKTKPVVKGFAPLMEGGAQTLGLYAKGTVYIHTRLGGRALYKTALEEVVHHVTGAGDMSRDFQDFLLGLIAEIAF